MDGRSALAAPPQQPLQFVQVLLDLGDPLQLGFLFLLDLVEVVPGSCDSGE